MLELWDGTRKNWQASLFHTGLHKTHTRWLVRSWSTFDARTNHSNTDTQNSPQPKLGGSHHLPPYSTLCTSPQGPHLNDFLSRNSWMGVPKSPKLGLSQLWSPITLWADLGSRCGLKQSCSPCWEISNGMLHVVYRQVNRVDSWLFIVGNQIGILTPSPSFGHNLCFKCPNGRCKPILNI
jgi:hypothetical protein